MITEIVLFKLPEGMTRDQLVANYRASAPRWRENPDLIRKNYIFDPINRQGGGVYLWKDIAAAQRWHGDDFIRVLTERYGEPPVVRYCETPIVVDNDAGKTVDESIVG